MIRDVTPKQAVEFLNEMVELDHSAMMGLINARVPAGKGLVDHLTVQVGMRNPDNQATLGLLGLLNGMFGVFDDGPKKGFGPITMRCELDDDGRVACICGFELTVPEDGG